MIGISEPGRVHSILHARSFGAMGGKWMHVIGEKVKRDCQEAALVDRHPLCTHGHFYFRAAHGSANVL